MIDPLKLAVDAAMAMIDRYGSDHDRVAFDHDGHLRDQLTVIMEAAMTLGSDYGPRAWKDATSTLESMIKKDA